MDYFEYKSGELFAENVSIKALAERFGTPLYVYSKATLARHYKVFDESLGTHPHKICYAVKANSNLGVLSVLAELGAGFDIVSGGELERVLAAGGDPKKIVFSGVGKLDWEIRRALEVGIYCFNAESWPELLRLNEIAAQMGKTPEVALRVNPHVDAKTHPYIATGLKESKFGVDIDAALALYEKAAELPHLRFRGVDCHIGSQLTELAPLLAAFDKVYELVKSLKSRGFDIRHLDLGGGLGVPYMQETPPSPGEYATAIRDRFRDNDLEIILEPGRAIVANAGILVSKVEYLKKTQHKNFAIIDAAMNDYMRPALYDAVQNIIPAIPREGKPEIYDVVGPVCETGDFLGKERSLVLEQGEYLVIRTAGAYGFSMSSNYNSRPRAAEVMVDGDQAYEVRQRETLKSLYAKESRWNGKKPWDGSFTKMHSLGNDFVIIDGVRQEFNPTPELIQQMGDRHTGIGFDQLLICSHPRRELPKGEGGINKPFLYKIFNADGTEAYQCGNGARCLAHFIRHSGLSSANEIQVTTKISEMTLKPLPNNMAAATLGIPSFSPDVNYQGYVLSTLNIGNPHAVLLVDNVTEAPVDTLGASLQNHEKFPDRVNVGFMQILNPNEIKLRVYERGVGETLACGSGASAAVIVGIKRGLLNHTVKVLMPGGELQVSWEGETKPVWLMGPISFSYQGKWNN